MNKGKKNMSKKFTLMIGLVLTFGLLITSACWTENAKETNIENDTKGETAVNENESPMAKVDFKNFSYPMEIGAKDEMEKSLTLKDGKLEKTKTAKGAELGKVQYADLTGDKIDEAIVEVGITGEKDAKSNMVYVYTLENEKPKLLWNFETAGGEKNGIKEISAKDGKLLVEMFGDVKFNKGNFEVVKSKEKVDGKTTKIELEWKDKGFEVVENKAKAADEKEKSADTNSKT